MDETGQEETRPESAHSDNGSEEGGFVEVTREDAQMASQSWERQEPQPAVEDELDLYGDAAAEALDEDEEKVRGAPHPVAGEGSSAKPRGSWLNKLVFSNSSIPN